MPELWLARHGETEWSLSHQHTSRTDLPLTENGERQGRALAPRLAGRDFALVVSSPAQRARRTAELAGFADVTVDEDLREYDYGDFEGLTTPEIQARQPGWDLWRDGCPGGESTAEIAARIDGVIERLRSADGDVLVFGHGHASRVLATRWIGIDVETSRYLVLSTASLSIVGEDHGHPAITLWNDESHLREAA
jgi:probable phosphoglycerate mutase